MNTVTLETVNPVTIRKCACAMSAFFKGRHHWSGEAKVAVIAVMQVPSRGLHATEERKRVRRGGREKARVGQ